MTLPPQPSDLPTTYVSVPPASAVPSIPVVSIQPAPSGGGHVLSLTPGARIVAPALPRRAWRKLVDAFVVVVVSLTVAWVAYLSPAQAPALVGILGLAAGYYFRTRRPRAEITAGAPVSPSEPPAESGDSSAP